MHHTKHILMPIFQLAHLTPQPPIFIGSQPLTEITLAPLSTILGNCPII
jgi:hypothetical protein